MKVIAVLTTRNEEKFIESCLKHLISHQIQIVLIDHESVDNTQTIARFFLGKGLLQIFNQPFKGFFDLRDQLAFKQKVIAQFQADWFMHVDADEFHEPSDKNLSLAQFIEEIDQQGYNAINFLEYTFIPTNEYPDHDHAYFQKTMRWYYPFLPSFPHRVNAWKSNPNVDLVSSGGHIADFEGKKLYPSSQVMRHYLCLSKKHAESKFNRPYSSGEIAKGWHGWRPHVKSEKIFFPSMTELRFWESDTDVLDPSNPKKEHFSKRWI